MMRYMLYASVSMTLGLLVVGHGLHKRANFFSCAVHIAQSNACLMILSNLAILIISAFLLGIQRILYGRLRAIETEQLYERAWLAVTETCLAMTVFRDEVGFWFLTLFLALLIGKVATWISNGRLDIYEQQRTADDLKFHARLFFALLVTNSFIAFLFFVSIRTVLREARPNMMVMFAFEYAVLLVTSISICARYGILLREAFILRQQNSSQSTDAHAASSMDAEDGDTPGWENKRLWLFYLDIGTDLCKLVLYLSFFGVLCVFFGMPIHIIRDVAITLRSFYKRLSDFMHFKAATRNMDAQYPDATKEEIQREDCCIICRDVMRIPPNDKDRHASGREKPQNRMRPKRLACGHVIHLFCLKSWLERQQNCPICRASVLPSESQNTSITTASDHNHVATEATRHQMQSLPERQVVTSREVHNSSVTSSAMEGPNNTAMPTLRDANSEPPSHARSRFPDRAQSQGEQERSQDSQVAHPVSVVAGDNSRIGELLEREILDTHNRLRRLKNIKAHLQGTGARGQDTKLKHNLDLDIDVPPGWTLVQLNPA